MITDKKLIHLTQVDGIDFYRYDAKLFNYFYTPMAYYEKLFSRQIRETLDYIRGKYYVIYFANGDSLVGYGIVTKGGGRNKFATKNDVVFNSLYIDPKERGKGLGKLLVSVLLPKLNLEYDTAYEYIRHDNLPSIKATEHNGFVKVSNAVKKGILKKIVPDENGSVGIYAYKNPKNR